MKSIGGSVTLVGLTLILAGLDVTESVLAKEWVLRRSPWLLVAGLGTSFLLFGLFVIAIGYTEMSTVTIGWIVVMQLGLMITETVRYDVSHSADRWFVMCVVIALLGYLVASPANSA